MLRSHIITTINISYESTGVEDLYQLLAEEVQSQNCKLDSLAWLLSGSEKELFLCEIGSKAWMSFVIRNNNLSKCLNNLSISHDKTSLARKLLFKR